MSVATVPVKQDVEDASLDHDARRPVARKLPEFFPKPSPGVDHRGHEIVERLPLHRDPFLHTFYGVVPGW